MKISFKKVQQKDESLVKVKKKKEIKVDKIFIIFLLIFVLFLIGIIVSLNYNMFLERKQWYNSHYFISSKIENNIIMSVQERKKLYQLKIIGLLKKYKSTMNDKEVYECTNYIFDKCEDYQWSLYLPISFMKTESKYDKEAVGELNEKGLYQFRYDTAKMACKLAGIDYYNGVEHNPLDSTKMWFAYFKYLLNQFNGDLSLAIIAYNYGEGNIFNYLKPKFDNQLKIYDFKNVDIEKLNSDLYIKNKKEPYIDKIYNNMISITNENSW